MGATKHIGAGSDRRRSRFAVLVLALPLLLGAVADADEQHASLFGSEGLLGVQGNPCPLRLIAGDHACPGCGLTRGTALAVQGNLRASWHVHPAAWLVALLCAAGIAIHTRILIRGERTAVHARLLRQGHRIFVVGLFAAWLGRLIL